MIIYLAGPDVFHPKAIELGELKKEICKQYGFDAIFPTDDVDDSVWSLDKISQGRVIRQACIDSMLKADCVVANMTPFRGAGMDGGTAFEMGFMDALNKPVFAYTHNPYLYITKVLEKNNLNDDEIYVDKDNYIVENFNAIDNCMMVHTVLKYMDHIPCAKTDDFFDLSGLIKALEMIKK